MQTDDTTLPIFDLGDHYPTTVPIGDQRLPIRVKRFSRSEMAAFEKKWSTYIVEPRGMDALESLQRRVERLAPDGIALMTRDEAAALITLAEHGGVEEAKRLAENEPIQATRANETRAFLEETIREAITLDEGLVRDRGHWVTDGVGLIGVFHARPDVLASLVGAVCKQNRLTDVIRKNSSSPRDSVTGSAPSNPEPSGRGPEQSAASADGSGSASPAAATAGSDATSDTSPASSGASNAATQIH